MGCLTWSYQLLCLQLLLFYSITSAPLCLLEESSALLQFKQLFLFPYPSFNCNFFKIPYPKMMSWKEASDCCSWDGVTCDMVTGRVIGLDLSCSWLHGNIPSNATLFLLHHLQTLNLAFNYFNSSQISSDFSQLSSLTLLNLSNSYFEGQIPSEISHLSKLVLLDLSSYLNDLSLETPVLEGLVQNLTQLRELALDHVNMSTVIPSSLSNLSSSLTSLSLVNCGMQGNFPEHIFDLKNLQVLDLRWNINLTGNFPKVNWSNPLKYLDISYTSLTGALPNSIGNIKSLRYLSLSYCKLFGSIPASLANLTQLTLLDLSRNSFVGSIPTSLANLTQLTLLDMSSNTFVGSITASIAGLTQLTCLDLSRNSFGGSIPTSLANLTQLATLDLSSNSLSGTIPGVFLNLTQLFYLSLEDNQLGGPIPSSVGDLRHLASISLKGNSFDGPIPSWLFTLPSLASIDLSYNHLTGQIEEFQSNSLQSIFLESNRLHGSIPSSIFELGNLNTLVLSSNNLSGGLEFYMFAKLKELQWLDLSYNSISISTTFKENSSFLKLSSLILSACNLSEFPNNLRSSTHLEWLDLSDNKIQGQIPNWIWHIGENLQYIVLRSNFLHGPIPNSSLICNMSSIEVIDLSNNSLTGNIPECLGNNSNSLRVLDLQRNRFNGSIPHTFAEGNHLETVSLNDNELDGQVPESLVNCRMLEVLDIGNNKINDTFPYWLGNLPKLRVLVLRSNQFYGSVWHVSKISSQSFSELRILDLSDNSFSGSLPIRYFENMKAMINVDEVEKELQYMGDNYYKNSVEVTLKGSEIVLVKIITIFTTIDLSDNIFQGEIPEIIGKLHALRLLNLSHNNLKGCIPSSLGNLAVLESLDLSSNKLVGKIPWQLSRLSFLQILNLSENQLWGPIPTGNHFDTFPTTSYDGNLGLCGFPLPNKCGVDDTQQSPSKLQDDAKSRDGFGWKSVLIGYGCGVAFGVSMGYLMFWTGKPRWVVEIVAYWIVQVFGINVLAKKGRRLNKKRGGR